MIRRYLLRWVIRLLFAGFTKGTLAEQRARQDKAARFGRLPQGVTFRKLQEEGLDAAWIAPANPSQGVILYFHGGGYVLGSAFGHRELLGRLAATTGMRCLAVDYRLAPEHPFPAALEDGLSAWRWLRQEEDIPARRIFLAGDSAGGGLAVAVLLRLREVGEECPAGAVLFSPWVDLTLSGASIQEKAGRDPILTANFLADCARHYAGTTPLTNPLLSPLFADLHGLPPLMIHVGTEEILLDDARRLADAAESAGVSVRLHIWPGMFHVFPLLPFAPEARQALEEAAAFVKRY
jgi:acetyl esterase/lipase